MLISREELRFDFQGSKFDLNSVEDRKLLAWIFNQFLYGEVTGIQCGHWLYQAPSLGAATFIARQAGEELAHVRKILRIFSLLGEKPQKAHRSIQFLSTGMMGGTWGEHVTLEMALGEGLVLGVFYAMADTIPDGDIQKILVQAAAEEERHVEFGERETEVWLKSHPESRPMLLGLALVQVIVLHRLKKFVLKTLTKTVNPSHPVLNQFEKFYEHSLRCFERRIDLLKLSGVPLEKLTRMDRTRILMALPFRILAGKFRPKQPLLTETYLEDPVLEIEAQRFPLSQVKLESDPRPNE